VQSRRQKAKKAVGIVLDLRNNPGGLLNSAVDVASQFLNGGLVVSTKGRVEKNQRRDVRRTREGK
jgi:Periplasmic protease